jgi:hypothetical protein
MTVLARLLEVSIFIFHRQTFQSSPRCKPTGSHRPEHSITLARGASRRGVPVFNRSTGIPFLRVDKALRSQLLD